MIGGKGKGKMAKKYYWLRLKEDFFKSLAMKKLRRIAGGEVYTIIYLKMQLLSLRDEGYLYFEGIENSFAEELALVLDENEENVKITLSYLQNIGLIQQINETEFLLTEVPAMIGKETDKAEIMRRKRAKEKLESIENGNNVTSLLPPVTFCSTEIEIEKEIEKEIDIEREKRETTNYQEIIGLYNDTCVSFPHLTKLSEARKKAIRARLKTYSIDDFKQMFEKAEASSFLKGKNNRNWSATFDWMIKDANMSKILDGNYDDRGGGSSGNKLADELQADYERYARWGEQDDN